MTNYRFWHCAAFPVLFYISPRTTDAQRGNSLHCMAKNSFPLPNFLVWLTHILSATSAWIFRYLWFMPSLGFRSPCLQGNSIKFSWNLIQSAQPQNRMKSFLKKTFLFLFSCAFTRIFRKHIYAMNIQNLKKCFVKRQV